MIGLFRDVYFKIEGTIHKQNKYELWYPETFGKIMPALFMCE